MDIIYYVAIDMLLILVMLFLLFLVFYRSILIYLDILIDDLRWFIQKNDSFFTILFLIIFFVEQLFLVILIHFFRGSLIILQLIVGIFALIVITTASLQKIILDVRVKYFKEESEAIENSYLYLKETLDRYKKISKKK